MIGWHVGVTECGLVVTVGKRHDTEVTTYATNLTLWGTLKLNLYIFRGVKFEMRRCWHFAIP